MSILLELDKTDCLEAETGGEMEMGDDSIDVTDEMEEQSSSKRCEAGDALNDGMSSCVFLSDLRVSPLPHSSSLSYIHDSFTFERSGTCFTTQATTRRR